MARSSGSSSSSGRVGSAILAGFALAASIGMGAVACSTMDTGIAQNCQPEQANLDASIGDAGDAGDAKADAGTKSNPCTSQNHSTSGEHGW